MADFQKNGHLWLYLNDDATEADLFREYFGLKPDRKVNYRIFTGETKSVDCGDGSVYGKEIFRQRA